MSRILTVALKPEAGPAVFPMEVGISSAQQCVRLRAWTGKNSGINCYILQGNVSLPEAEQQIAQQAGVIDPLLAVPGAGIVELDTEVTSQQLTVFFEHKNETTQNETVTIEIC